MSTLRGWVLAVPMLAACAGSHGRTAQPPASGERAPNFVVILADDLGYGDIGPYGSPIRTPHLDRMAKEGARLTSFYVAQGVCSASRAALLTGSYSNRVGVLYALLPHQRKGLLAPGEITIAETLRTRGYATAIYGKWHLGDEPAFLPTRQGFDEYFGLPYSNDMWPQHPNNQAFHFPPLPLLENERAIAHNPDQTQLVTWYTERAVKFIETHTAQPFFLYVPHNMPHVPLFASAKQNGKSGRLYADVIAEIDWSVGQILDALRRTGQAERTLVVFTSDNGPWLPYGDHAGSAGPLREGKSSTFEGGVRVPALFWWPGRIPAGHHTDEIASTIDLLPTFARLAGASLPGDRVLDGKDILPLVTQEAGAPPPHDAFYYYWGNGLEAVRSGHWKLHFPHKYPHVEVPGVNGRPGKSSDQRIDLSLFDLEADVGETTNVAAAHPDIVTRLQALGERAREDLGDSLTERKGKNMRAAGTF